MTIQHIAFIMDGNRRYAKKNGYALEIGYKKGMEKFLEFISFQVKYNIPITTFFALSKDNAEKRPDTEKDILLDLMEFFSKNEDIETYFKEQKIKINLKGNLKKLKNNPFFNKNEKFKSLLKKFEKYDSETENYNFIVNIAINYDGQEEIVDSVNEIIKKMNSNEIPNKKITADLIKKHNFLSDCPEPNIIVRPGNVQRLSGFLLWDSQYSEIYFSKKLWPELNESDFLAILEWYKMIKRNFGR